LVNDMPGKLEDDYSTIRRMETEGAIFTLSK
jgi:hypothetical protein